MVAVCRGGERGRWAKDRAASQIRRVSGELVVRRRRGMEGSVKVVAKARHRTGCGVFVRMHAHPGVALLVEPVHHAAPARILECRRDARSAAGRVSAGAPPCIFVRACVCRNEI